MTDSPPPQGVRRLGFVARAVGCIALACLTACEGTGPSFRSTSVEIVPSVLVFDALGVDSLLQARVVDDDGRDRLGARIRWSSSQPEVATVDDTGRVTAVTRGSTTVRATATGLGFIEASATATVEVAPVVAALEVIAGAGQTGTVDRPLPETLRVRATDRSGEPVVGQQVMFSPSSGSGLATPAGAQTDTDGVAASEWTLGPLAGGLHLLSVNIPGAALGPTQFEALAVAGPPALVEIETGEGQFATRGQPLSQPIVVRIVDSFGNGIGGEDVTFSVADGEGGANPETTPTDLTGAATTFWTLGATVGSQRLRVDAGAATTQVEAIATEPPAGVQATSSSTLIGTVGMPVAEVPSVVVVDGHGAPVPGVEVVFDVTAGGGTVEVGQAFSGVLGPSLAAPTVVHTDAQGRAAVAAWTLGTMAGAANQALRASVAGVANVVFTATAQAGPPAALTVVGGEGQAGPVTVELPEPVTVRVSDAFDNPVGGIEVGFTPSGGFATPPSQMTDAQGTASTRWTLGPLAGPLVLDVTAPGSAPPVRVTGLATGSVPTCALDGPTAGYDIEICWVGAEDPVVAAALDLAVARWEALVVGDVPDVTPNPDHSTCLPGAPWVSGTTLDDLVLYIVVEPIDGPSGGLAGASPCFVRDANSLPTFARIRVDRDDVASLSAAGQLVDVLLHEIGHALGFGTLWPMAGLLADPSLGAAGSPPDTHFTGAGAIVAFDEAGGAGRTVGAKVPVENRGGGGVADVHWRESVLGPELMTSELNTGTSNALSRISTESLADMGYDVAADQSDAYVVPFPNFPVVGSRDATVGTISLGEDIWWGPIGVVDAAGSLVRIHRFQRRP